MKISKKKFVAQLSEKTGCTVVEATKMYESFISVLSENILSGNEVVLMGFCRLYLSPRQGHIIRSRFSNSDTMQESMMKDHLVLKLSTSDGLNRSLRTLEEGGLLDKVKAAKADKTKSRKGTNARK